MTNLILLARPLQWLKNLFVFLPLFFAGELFNCQLFLSAFATFVVFSLTASAVYCINDLLDAPADRLHPKKKFRPIASGKVTSLQAIILSSFLLTIAVLVIALGGGTANLLLLLFTYIFINIAYSFKLKFIPIVDVFIIAFGFVLRLLAGSVSTNIDLSMWIVVMTFLLSLFLGFAKRREDVYLFENSGVMARKNIDRYNLQFMNQVITVLASVTLVAYIMYTISPDIVQKYGTNKLYFTSIFVLAGIIRYLQISIVDMKSGSPTKVLIQDRFIQVCLLFWCLTFMVIIYA